MYRLLLRRMQISPVAVKRHYWTQGDGPQYSSNMLMVGFGTVICAVIGVVSFPSHIVWFQEISPLNRWNVTENSAREGRFQKPKFVKERLVGRGGEGRGGKGRGGEGDSNQTRIFKKLTD